MRLIGFFLLLLFGSPKEKQEDPSYRWEIIAGRNSPHNTYREPLYRICTPSHWKRVDPSTKDTLEDTKRALCEFFIDDKIRITIHNFPSESIDDRVPPAAQIARWKRQLETSDDNFESIKNQSFSGYIGLLYEGRGENTAIMGWAMQLGPDQYRILSRPNISSQKQADVTIKATGPVTGHRDEIIHFARSFELIEEIPVE